MQPRQGIYYHRITSTPTNAWYQFGRYNADEDAMLEVKKTNATDNKEFHIVELSKYVGRELVVVWEQQTMEAEHSRQVWENEGGK